MAKDAKGHGSEKRGDPNAAKEVFSSRKGVGPHGPGMYAALNSGALLKLNPEATGGRIPGVGTVLDPAQHTVARDAAAAGALAQGHPKSAPVPVHAGASGRHGYDPVAVDKAIASSNRAGRRIGGKEAAAIHRLLRGR